MWPLILVTVIAGYLLGNLNGAVLVSNEKAHEDVREKGSGNGGLTNFSRSYGGKWVGLVILIDVGKTLVACLVGGLLLRPEGLWYTGVMLGGVAASLGHDFPALLSFRGGKGILCGITVACVVDWRTALAAVVAFVLTYLLSGYVSAGSLLGATALGVCFGIFWYHEPTVMLSGIFLAALAIFMHRENIRRILNGTERKTILFGKGSRS